MSNEAFGLALPDRKHGLNYFISLKITGKQLSFLIIFALPDNQMKSIPAFRYPPWFIPASVCSCHAPLSLDIPAAGCYE
jgi:hypothetical protein